MRGRGRDIAVADTLNGQVIRPRLTASSTDPAALAQLNSPGRRSARAVALVCRFQAAFCRRQALAGRSRLERRTGGSGSIASQPTKPFRPESHAPKGLTSRRILASFALSDRSDARSPFLLFASTPGIEASSTKPGALYHQPNCYRAASAREAPHTDSAPCLPPSLRIALVFLFA
jgi:hypothetical protein